MPSRWFVPIPGLDVQRLRLEFVHAAVTRWFDGDHAAHVRQHKPYAISPPAQDETGVPGVEIGILTSAAETALSGRAGSEIRLGNQIRRVGTPRLLTRRSWSDLAARRHDTRWELEFATPTTFRTGSRASPYPRPETILDGLLRTWQEWSDHPMAVSGQRWPGVWVSDLDLRSDVVDVRVGRAAGPPGVLVSGCLGRMTLRCDDEQVAAAAGPLLRLAEFCGVGSMTAKGFGVTRVTTTERATRVRAATAV